MHPALGTILKDYPDAVQILGSIEASSILKVSEGS
jgi:hypothetical protein